MVIRTAIILLSFLIILIQDIFASVVCSFNYSNGAGILYPGDSSVMTINGCGIGDIEFGRGYVYQFYDPLACPQTMCNTYRGCEVTESWCNVDYTRQRGRLQLSGDVEKYGIISVGYGGEPKRCIGKGDHEGLSFMQNYFDLLPLGDEPEEGYVAFTFYALADKQSCDHIVSEGDVIFNFNGNFSVVKNDRESLDIFNLLFNASNAMQGVAYIKTIPYNHLDMPFSRKRLNSIIYCENDSHHCDTQEVTEVWRLDKDTSARRIKLPAWKRDVWVLDSMLGEQAKGQLVSYMSSEGWCLDLENNQVWLDLAGFGKIYFSLGTPSASTGFSEYSLLDSIKYCPEGFDPNQIQPKWRCKYEYNSFNQARLKYVYDGNDSENPESSPHYYKYQWTEDQKTVTQEYYNTNVGISNPLRVETASFDSKGRPVEFSAGCASGCSGGGHGYNRVEFYDEYEGSDNLVKKKYNRNGDVVLHNIYKEYLTGFDLPENNILVENYSFEQPIVPSGEYTNNVPSRWLQVGGQESIRILNPSLNQWVDRYDEGQIIPNGNQILSLSEGRLQTINLGFVVAHTTYVLEADAGAFIDPNTSWASIKLLAYNPLDVNELPVELITIDTCEDTDPEGFGTRLIQGEWSTQSGIWSYAQNPAMQGRVLRIVVEGNWIDIVYWFSLKWTNTFYA